MNINNKDVRILVTGGSGFIGTNLVNELRSRNYKVIACDLLNHELKDYIRCDVRNYRHIKRVFDKYGPFDYVYHLAAEYGRWNGEDHYENLWETNVIGTKHMIRLQESHKFRMIFFSSAEVYGDYMENMSEDVMINNPIKDSYQMNDYAISKWAGELICMNSEKMFNTETVRVRPVNCYGPYEEYNPYRGFVPKFIYHALFNKKYSVYKGHKRIIDYVEDTCKTFANIIENFKPGEAYNIGSRIEWEKDVKEISDIILNYLNLDDSIVQYYDVEPHTTKIKKIDFSKAIKDLNHNPKISPEEGIKKTIDWMKEHYRLNEKNNEIKTPITYS
jgi:dTDP-glucose 4,6-dehydratase